MSQTYSWASDKPYNDFSSYFRRLFAGRVQKISVDAGFSCPNRDGTKARHGCAYCNNASFSPDYCREQHSISQQLEEGIQFFSRKYKTMRYLAYFQSYSNTYGSIELLKKRYEEALSYPGVIGLVIGTRPDCVNEEILDFLSSLTSRATIFVEYGLESVLDRSLKRINRGHTYAESEWAVKETAARGIHCGAHFILGLPGETYDDFMQQADIVSGLPLNSIKLHQLQIHKNTQFGVEYTRNPSEFNLFTPDEYLNVLVDYLERLNPEIVVERFISQAPDNLLIAPRWGLKNFEFTAKLEKKLKELNSWQGKNYHSEQ